MGRTRGAYLAATLVKIPGSGTWPPVSPPGAPPPTPTLPCAAIGRFEAEAQNAWGEDSRKSGEKTSGKENVSYERGSETDLSSVSETFNCVKSGWQIVCMGKKTCLSDLRDFKIFSGSEIGEVCLLYGLFLVFFRLIASLLIVESPSEK